MLGPIKEYVGAKVVNIKSMFASKPHFNFISAHYIWIISSTIVASIALYAGGKGKLDYINCLLFASGANTQAGLNPVDVDLLNTFQQIVMYLFPMISNPITLHSSVLVLRLYWFEKRFQSLVKDVRQRRVPLTKTKSKARDDVQRAEAGINLSEITRVAPENDRRARLTNDGTMLVDDEVIPKNQAGSTTDGSDSTVAHGSGKEHRMEDEELGADHADSTDGADNDHGSGQHDDNDHRDGQGATAITFAETVKRSDGVEDDPTNFVQHRPTSDHIAILERQRNQDNEVLRIPGPREAEQGLGPRRLDESDDNEDDNTLAMAITRDSRPERATVDPRNIRRNATITIAEPEHRESRMRDEVAEDAKAWGNTLDALRFRKPRAFNKDGQNKLHEDHNDDDDASGAQPDKPPRSRPSFKPLETIRSALTANKDDDMPYLSYTPTMGRNSNFIGLTFEQREELGGIEYRSLRTLMYINIGYYWGFQLLGLTFLLPFIQHNNHYGKIVSDAGVARTWWAFFTANGAFNDVGFTLTANSMISFQTSEYVLMVMWFFIIIGNTGFPVMLRFIIWIMSHIVPRGTGLWEELRFLLDHPRRCFTLLFPSAANWWLFWILVVLNAVDLIFFIILDLHSEVVQELSVSARIVNGLFQAASTRTAGFASLPLSELHPAIPVLYMIMMYIGVFPIAISIRRTNVYEEKSLGVYQNKKNDDDDNDSPEVNAMSYVGTHLRRQLSFDLWFVSLGFFLLAIAEGDKIKAGRFDMFAILFEIISAYGTVGLSLGAAGINASLCSQFSVVGKLIIIAMEIRGRHRGLPYGLDRAVILPSESRFKLRDTQDTEPTDLPRIATTASAPGPSNLHRRGSMGSTGRGRSISRDTDRRLITKLLHPGPAVPPGVVHSHHRTRSSTSQDLSLTMTRGSKRPQSLYPVEDVQNEAVEEALEPTESRLQAPKRAETLPM